MKLYRLLTSKWTRKVRRLERERRQRIPNADVVVVSFPKSGKTWLRALVTTLYQRRHGLPERLLIDHDNLHRLNAAIPVIYFTHDCDPLGSVGELRRIKPEYAGRKVVFLARNPADVVVSHYHQLKHRKAGKRENATRGMDLFDFVTEPGRGIEYIIAFMNQWSRFAKGDPNVFLLRYEELKQAPDITISRLSEFLGTPFSNAEIAEAVKICSFENLQRREREGYYRDSALQPADRSNQDSFKVRRGKVGGYRDYFTEQQVAVIDCIVATTLDPEIGYCAKDGATARSECGLRLKAAIDRPSEIERLLEPMILRRMSAQDAAWRAVMARLARKTRLGAWRSRWLGWLPIFQRDGTSVREKYERIWARIGWPDVKKPASPAERRYCLWRNDCLETQQSAVKRIYIFALAQAIRMLSPASAMEVGAGNGVNLLLLASMLPHVTFTGIELTNAGVDRAKRAQSADLPEELQRFAASPVQDLSAHRRVHFQQGDARSLACPSNGVDLVFTVLALEQMETIRHQVIAEIARIASRYVIFIEPFQDWNLARIPRDYVAMKHYFSMRVGELSRYGLMPIFQYADLPQRPHLGVGIVVCEKYVPALQAGSNRPV